MGRWDPDAKGRLERAALELFAEQGFAETTVPQIAEHAGLTTRTFFRYFADKREVLFDGEEEMGTLFAGLISAAPPELAAMDTIEHALKAAAESVFEPRRQSLCQWHAVVSEEEALRERGLRKQQVIIEAVVEALGGRGVDRQSAELAAGAAFVAFQAAMDDWLTEDQEARPLVSCLEVFFTRMRRVAAETLER